MKKHHRWQRGFTVVEVLITVAVLVVLIGISIPAVAQWSKELKMAELDAHAKEIYLSAQYQLTAMNASGSLPSFGKKMNTDHSARKLTTKPTDADDTANWSDLYYLQSDDAMMERLISGTSFAAQVAGDFLIEFDPLSGVVYSVFYWEKDEAIDYDTQVKDKSRERADRAEYRLGYYGGSLTPASDILSGLDAKAFIENGEELYLRLSVARSQAVTANKANLSVKVTLWGDNDPTKTKVWTLDGYDFKYTVDGGKRLEAYILLDSLATDCHFEKLTGGVQPGNFTVQVDAEFTAVGKYPGEHPGVIELKDNSLFAKMGAEESGTVIEVDAVRHLRNLDARYFNNNVPAGKVTVKQVNHIDFLNTDFAWDGTTYAGKGQVNPLLKAENEADCGLVAIQNNDLLNRLSGDNSIVCEDNFAIRNFVIKSEGINTGLFAQLANMTITGLRLENIRVSGGENTGGLAGTMTACTVKNCGVYLKNQDELGRLYSSLPSTQGGYASEMDRRYAYYRIQGGANTGGLAGLVKTSHFTQCFAAVAVKATGDNVGGFAGQMSTSSTANNCYASGDVVGSSHVGGFLGGGILSAEASYATGNVRAASHAGGFVGACDGGAYTKCKSYGRVDAASRAGGFVGERNGATFDTCAYLTQTGYNEFGSSTMAKTYSALRVADVLDASYPYDKALVGKFPFEATTINSHYGNWPARQVIDTSLVYYEKYLYRGANGAIVYESDGVTPKYTYGYYCVTGLASAEGGDADNSLIWVLNTLKKDLAVEDGYALLSIYNLSQFDYTLTQYTNADGTGAKQLASGTLTVQPAHVGWSGNTATDATRAVHLRQQGALTFSGYKATNSDGSARGATTDFSVLTPVDNYDVTGMYLFQLPHDLQNVNRKEAKTFYDELIIDNGCVGSNEVIDRAKKFYYCAHFAKTAVNPSVTGGASFAAKLPPFASLRSPRQLNALGRYPYYWNTQYGNFNINIRQENDVSFSAYTSNYCGQALDLIRTNCAIGNPDLASNGNGQFRGTYDGQGYRIIDFGIESKMEFVGLFGETVNATIKNVTMTVSNQGRNPSSRYGKIVCKYDGRSGGDRPVGVGAIVGLSYYNQKLTNSPNVIENCSVSGYTISYVADNNTVPGIAMGGLAGYNMGTIRNCSAVNDVKLTMTNSGKQNALVSMGGLAGTSFYFTVENCYSGGTLTATGSQRTDKLVMGGVLGGVHHIYSDCSDASKTNTIYRNLYSYTKMYPQVKAKCYPTVAKVWQGVATTGGSQMSEGKMNAIAEDNWHYLTGHYADGETEPRYEKEFGAKACTYMGLSKLTIGDAFGKADASHSYPYSASLAGKAYPFPAVVKRGGAYVHYGDWPKDNSRNWVILEGKYVGTFFYEKYEDGTYGVLGFGAKEQEKASPAPPNHDNPTVNTLIKDVSKIGIVERGYGVFYYEGCDPYDPVANMGWQHKDKDGWDDAESLVSDNGNLGLLSTGYIFRQLGTLREGERANMDFRCSWGFMEDGTTKLTGEISVEVTAQSVNRHRNKSQSPI